MQYGIGNLAQRPEFGLGDFVSDVFKPVRKVVNKVVPRELQPILPVVASAFLGPMVGGMFSALGPAAAGFLGAGTTSALTQALTGSGQIDPTSTLLSAGIGGIQGARIPKDFAPTEKFSGPVKKPTASQLQQLTDPSALTGDATLLPQAPTFQGPVPFTPGTEAYNKAMENAGFFDRALMRAKEYTGSLNVPTGEEFSGFTGFERGPDSILKGATAFSLPYTAKAAAEEQLDLEEQERQAGIESAARRRKDKQIYIDFVMRAGFTREEAERMAEGAGYSEGGRVNAFLGRFFSKGIGQAAKLAERGIKPFGQKQTYKQSVKTTGVSEEQFNEILEKQLNRVPDEVVDQPTGEALYRSLLDAEAVITGQKLGLLTQEQRTQIAKAMKDKVSKQIYDNPVPGMNNDYLEYMDGKVTVIDGKEVIGAQVDFKQLDELGDKGKDNIVPFKPKDEKAEGGRIKAQEGDFVSGIEAILNLPNITPTKRPDTEMDEEDEVDAFSERMERLGEDKFVSSGDTMKILRFFSKNPDAEQQYGGQLKDYIEEGKGSNAFFDSLLGSSFSEGGKVPGLPPGKQVDAREGTFIPMGGAKRADDVPAMLSVNEFVLNDNAVAGLGKMLTGTPDPRAGARALYKIQDQLEAMVV